MLIKPAVKRDEDVHEIIQIKENPPGEQPFVPRQDDLILRDKVSKEEEYDAGIKMVIKCGENDPEDGQATSHTSTLRASNKSVKFHKVCSTQMDPHINDHSSATIEKTFLVRQENPLKWNQPINSLHEGDTKVIIQLNSVKTDFDLCSVFWVSRLNQKDLSHKSTCSEILIHQGIFESWNHSNLMSDAKDIDFTNQCDPNMLYSGDFGFGRYQSHVWRPGEYLLQLDTSKETSNFILSHTSDFKGRNTTLVPMTQQEVYPDQNHMLKREVDKIKQLGFYAKAAEVEIALYSEQPMLSFILKETLMSLTNITPVLPSEMTCLLQEFEDLFPDVNPKGLPPEHQIDFVPGASLPNRPMYKTNPLETKELQRQIYELIEKGHIRESMSPCAIPVLLLPKKDGSWRLCVDFRAINNTTGKYHHPTPRLDDMLNELHGFSIFSKVDHKSGHHHIRMKEWEIWKTEFKCRHGLYEWLVMQLGLTNAPSTFIRLMNHVLRAYIGVFVVVYFDDILIYSKCLEEHIQHLKLVVSVLRKPNLYANLKKCAFCTDNLVFLSFVVSAEDIKVDEEKVKDKKPIAYFREELGGTTLNYPTYKTELHLNGQQKLNKGFARHEGFILQQQLLNLFGTTIKTSYVPKDVPKNLTYPSKPFRYKIECKKVLEVEDEVWAHVRKETLLEERKTKLMPRTDGPFKITKRINNNAYQLDLRGKYGVSPTFNVSDLVPFIADELDLRSNPFEEGGDDVILDGIKESELGDEQLEPEEQLKPENEQLEPEEQLGSEKELEPEDALVIPAGPMTRARAKKFNQAIGGLLNQVEKQHEPNNIYGGKAYQTTLVVIQAI